MEYIIREANETDYDQLIELFREFALFEKCPEKMINSVERMKAEQDYFHCFVAVTSGGDVIAYATHFFCYYTWTGKSLYMDDLYVSPGYRGQGIGTKLIGKIIQYAGETGCYRLRWQVSEWNSPAIGFYKKLGAVIDTTERNCDLALQ